MTTRSTRQRLDPTFDDLSEDDFEFDDSMWNIGGSRQPVGKDADPNPRRPHSDGRRDRSIDRLQQEYREVNDDLTELVGARDRQRDENEELQ